MLEQIYSIKLLEKNSFFALLLGISYTIIGIGLAVILFPEDPALVAVALISLMTYPTINGLMRQEEGIDPNLITVLGGDNISFCFSN